MAPTLQLPMRIRSKFLMCVHDFDFVVGAYNIYIYVVNSLIGAQSE